MANEYINFTKLENETLDTTIEVGTSWDWIENGIVEVFTKFPVIEWIVTIGLFYLFYQIFKKQNFREFTTAQNVLIGSFLSLMFNVFMLFFGWYVSILPAGFMGVIFIVALIMTVKD